MYRLHDGVHTGSDSPPNTTILFSTLRFAVYSRSRKATISSVFSPLIQSSFSWLARVIGQNMHATKLWSKCLPNKARVRRISTMMSFFRRRASRRDEHRLILRRNDSKCLASVRMVILSVVVTLEGGIGDRGWGSCASSTLRTFEISFLKRDEHNSQSIVKRHVLLTNSCSSL